MYNSDLRWVFFFKYVYIVFIVDLDVWLNQVLIKWYQDMIICKCMTNEEHFIALYTPLSKFCWTVSPPTGSGSHLHRGPRVSIDRPPL